MSLPFSVKVTFSFGGQHGREGKNKKLMCQKDEVEDEAKFVPHPAQPNSDLTSPSSQNSLGEEERLGWGKQACLPPWVLQLFAAPRWPAVRGCFLSAYPSGRAVVSVSAYGWSALPPHPRRPSLTFYSPDHPGPTGLWGPSFLS
jgi:hypothetical protein